MPYYDQLTSVYSCHLEFQGGTKARATIVRHVVEGGGMFNY